ncbi:MAG: HlyC/CorC family transporter [Erysipelotrichaceae bacterium]|nr:HlyC/CorC family transporter [Erysipelotrichaceae bacterium]
MDSSQILIIFSFIFLIILSAVYSGSETAFMSVSKIRIRTIAENDKHPEQKKALAVDQLLEDSDRLLSTILVGNNLVNIAASSLTTAFVLSIFGDQGIGVAIATGFVTLVILIFGEITPKTLSSNRAEDMCFALCGFIRFNYYLFTPVVILLTALSHLLIRFLGADVDDGPTLSEEDLKTIVDVSHEEGVLEDEEKEMLHNVFNFNDTAIEEIMTPRIHVEWVDDDITYKELMEVLRHSQFSRIPVHDTEQDEFVGVLNIKDLLITKIDKEHFDIKEIMREPFFVYEFQHLQDVFEAMRSSHMSIAIVLDEYGVMSGLVTLEDIVEEIFGDIDDEFDQDDHAILQITEREWILDGSLDIDEVNDICDTEFETDDFESIGGLVLGALKGNPKLYDKVTIDDTILTIERIDKNRISRLKLVKMRQKE